MTCLHSRPPAQGDHTASPETQATGRHHCAPCPSMSVFPVRAMGGARPSCILRLRRSAVCHPETIPTLFPGTWTLAPGSPRGQVGVDRSWGGSGQAAQAHSLGGQAGRAVPSAGRRAPSLGTSPPGGPAQGRGWNSSQLHTHSCEPAQSAERTPAPLVPTAGCWVPRGGGAREHSSV